MICSVCGADATVKLSTDEAVVHVCRNCARILECLGKLMGLNTRRRPALQVVE